MGLKFSGIRRVSLCFGNLISGFSQALNVKLTVFLQFRFWSSSPGFSREQKIRVFGEKREQEYCEQAKTSVTGKRIRYSCITSSRTSSFLRTMSFYIDIAFEGRYFSSYKTFEGKRSPVVTLKLDRQKTVHKKEYFLLQREMN